MRHQRERVFAVEYNCLSMESSMVEAEGEDEEREKRKKTEENAIAASFASFS